MKPLLLTLAALLVTLALPGCGEPTSDEIDLGFGYETYDPMKPVAVEVANSLLQNRDALDRRVMLIGLDSADMDIIDAMIAEGELPAFAKIKREGATGRLRSITPLLSPVIWTTVATGKDPSEHRVLDFVVPGETAGSRPQPVTSFHRKVESIWDILGTYGVSVGLIGWLASWPAEPVNGFVVSERVGLLGYEYGRREDEQRTGKTYPEGLMKEIEPQVAKAGDVPYKQIRQFLNISEKEYRATYSRKPEPANRINNFRLFLATSESFTRIGLDLWESRKPRFMAWYFEFLDATCHMFMPYTPPKMDHIKAEDYAKYKSAVAEAYRYADRQIAQAMEACDERTTLLIVSDHGFRSGSMRLSEDSSFHDAAAARWHKRFGIFMAWGNAVKHGAQISGASVYDITPTILALMGFPLAEDMPGHYLAPAFTQAAPAEPVASYERGRNTWEASDMASATPESEAWLAAIEALGYITAGQAEGREVSIGGYINLGSFLMSEQRYEEALAEFMTAHEKDPSSGRVMLSIGDVHQQLYDFESASKWFKDALTADPRLHIARMKYALSQKILGNRAVAIDEMRQAVKDMPDNAEAHLHLGRFEIGEGRIGAGERLLRKALEIEPSYPEAHNQIGILLLGRNQFAAAIREFDAAVKFQPGYRKAWNNLGVTKIRRANSEQDPQTREEAFDDALATFDRIIELFPEYAKAYCNRGQIYFTRNQLRQARADLEKALELDPKYADARQLLQRMPR